MAREWSERHIRELIDRYAGKSSGSYNFNLIPGFMFDRLSYSKTVLYPFQMPKTYNISSEPDDASIDYLIYLPYTTSDRLYGESLKRVAVSDDGEKRYIFSFAANTALNITKNPETGDLLISPSAPFGTSPSAAVYDFWNVDNSDGARVMSLDFRDTYERYQAWQDFKSKHQPMGKLYADRAVNPANVDGSNAENLRFSTAKTYLGKNMTAFLDWYQYMTEDYHPDSTSFTGRIMIERN